jgi:hypothetical protein
MFKLANLGIVFWPVQLPQTDGSDDAVTVHIGYQILTRKELRCAQRRHMAAYRETMDAATQAKPDPDALAALDAAEDQRDADEHALLRERIKGWRGIADEDGNAVPFAADKLDALLEFEFFAKPLLAGLYAASRGAPAKNSQPGPAGGAAATRA